MAIVAGNVSAGLQTRLASATSGERAHDLIGLEALADQVAIQSLEFLVVANRRRSSQAFRQSRREERVGVDIRKHLVDRVPGSGSRDAHALDLPRDAQLPTSLHRGLGPRNSRRRALIIYGTFGLQSCDRIVDGVLAVPVARETLAYLGFRQVAPGEHLQRVEVGGGAHGQAMGFRLWAIGFG